MGESTNLVANGSNWRIEQILSGRLEAPIDDCLDHDEWFVLLEGGAVIEVQGSPETLGSGDWMHLDPGVPHRVLATQPGTVWLAVHSKAQSQAPAD